MISILHFYTPRKDLQRHSACCLQICGALWGRLSSWRPRRIESRVPSNWSDGHLSFKCHIEWPLHGTCNHSPNGPQQIIPKSKSWNDTKNNLKCLSRFGGLGGLGVCGTDRKCMQLCACKIIWCKSVRQTPISWLVFWFCFPFLLLGLSASRAPA